MARLGQERFDVAVVGAGSAGSALAARLTEDAARSVVVLEAGPSYQSEAELPEEILNASALGAAVPGHPNNWSLVGWVVPGQSHIVPRGRIVGGSSAINGTLFTRGTPEDFHKWVQLGADEWSYEKVLPYYIRLEDDYDFQDEFHGTGGPMPVRRQGDMLHPISEAFLRACRDAGFPEEPDKNRPAPPGFGLIPTNNVDGERINAATAYLLPNQDRPNLRVEGDAFVRRVVFDGKRAVGVEVEVQGDVVGVEAAEIVLCAGAVKSAHLLLTSGVGPSDELEALGIPLVQHLPGVGKDFSDHPDVWVTYEIDGAPEVDSRRSLMQAGLTFTAQASEGVGDLEVLAGVVPLGESTWGSGAAGARMVAKLMKQPVTTLRALRGMPLRRIVEYARQRTHFMLFCSLQSPISRGEVRAKSADPSVPPELHYHYLGDERDRGRMREVVRLACDLLKARPFRELGASRMTPGDNDLASDDALDAWLRSHLLTTAHTTGTCKIGDSEDPMSVVDQYARVHGLEGVRVADTSIMPYITRRGPAATALMIGERTADFFGAV